jgi:hypothetical protein
MVLQADPATRTIGTQESDEPLGFQGCNGGTRSQRVGDGDKRALSVQQATRHVETRTSAGFVRPAQEVGSGLGQRRLKGDHVDGWCF